ncbi:hypothetical protein [Ureibacillus thermosphaericus]|uniref:Uncharacterized protein n=1 Tax=Ureibacillus thermosphaericus TaxID=51173 RepID=A0A840PTY6_URETH|nr:hypothetical protein [Ureibacillus thermosphaericus]MBB5148212.1 hypothetical protein [Ureibacillus thermosphaericus]NKZ31120.1 hypothetical protein [Ureibacillus thermosphaericus]
MDLKSINFEIAKEKACIDDLLIMIDIHVKDGNLDLATSRSRDLTRSLERVQKLENQRRFYITINSLAKQGVICEVVKRCGSLNGVS